MHVHVYAFLEIWLLVLESEQVAPFMHGDDAHSSTSTSQLYPANPRAQIHAYTNTPSTQVLPPAHG